METPFLAVVLVAMCGYAFLNGYRDASNSVATAVRTRALTPTVAVVTTALFVFAGTMLGTGLGAYLVSAVGLNLPAGKQGLGIMLAAVVAAGAWGLYCLWRGLPMSSTHAAISGLAGASAASAVLGGNGVGAEVGLILLAVGLPLVVTPIVGYVVAYVLVFPATWLLRHSSSGDVNRFGRAGQGIGACAVALGHGLQDGQRTGAMITLALVAGHATEPGSIPVGAQLAGAAFLSAGALGGGWRIAHTLGYRLVSIDPMRGMTAHAVSAAMLYLGSMVLHLPLSTTQAVASATVGAGANQRFESVMWRNVLQMVRYWLATPLVCALAAGILFLSLHPLLA